MCSSDLLIGEMTNPDWRARIADAGVVAARLAEVDVSDVDSAAAEARLSWLPVEVPTGERAGATMVPSDTAEPFADRRPRAGATISAMEAEGGPVAPLESGPGGARGAAAPTSSRPEPAPEAPQRPKGGAAPVAAPGGDAGRTSAESPSRRPADEKPGPTPEPADRAGTQRAGTLALGAVAGGAEIGRAHV